MDNLKQNIQKELKLSLSEKRYQHVMRVVQTARVIAEKYQVNLAQVEIAALAHDITKEKDKLWHVEQFKCQNMNDKFILETEPVMHSITGAYYLKEHYAIEDKQILNAITYHTLGHPQMDDVAKVVYIADYIEPNRKQSGVDKLRKMVGESSLDQIVYEIVKNEKEYLTTVNKKMHPDTIALYEKLQQKYS